MALVLLNNTASDVTIRDLGVKVPGSGSLAVESGEYHHKIARSVDLAGFTSDNAVSGAVDGTGDTLRLELDSTPLTQLQAAAYLAVGNLDGVDLSQLSFDDIVNGTLPLHGSTHNNAATDPVVAQALSSGAAFAGAFLEADGVGGWGLTADPGGKHLDQLRFARKGPMTSGSYLDIEGVRSSAVGHRIARSGALKRVFGVMESTPAGTVTVHLEDESFGVIDASASSATQDIMVSGLNEGISAGEELRVRVTTTSGTIPTIAVIFDIEID